MSQRTRRTYTGKSRSTLQRRKAVGYVSDSTDSNEDSTDNEMQINACRTSDKESESQAKLHLSVLASTSSSDPETHEDMCCSPIGACDETSTCISRLPVERKSESQATLHLSVSASTSSCDPETHEDMCCSPIGACDETSTCISCLSVERDSESQATSVKASSSSSSFEEIYEDMCCSPVGSRITSSWKSSPCSGNFSFDESLPGSSLPSPSSSVRNNNEEEEHFSEADEFSSSLECFEAHYLDEEPQDPNLGEQEGNIEEGGLDNLDDPDDPDDPDNNGNDNHSDEDDDDDLFPEVADLANDNLNEVAQVVTNVTKGEIMLLELACHMRHHDTFERVLDSFKNMNSWLGPRNGRQRGNFLPASKNALWSFIGLDTAGIQRHVYCGVKECGQYIGLRSRLGEYALCRCGYRVATTKAKFFVTLNIVNQIRYLLQIPGIWEKLQYPHTRRKKSPTALEDVFDGSEYKRLQREGEILSNPYNFTYCFNLDGVKMSNKGSLKFTPLYIRINELPPEMRQKFTILAAIHVDVVEPNPQSFLKPFVRQANKLSTTGINWKPDGQNDVNSKFIPFCHCCDSPIRHTMLNMAKWDSCFGCTYCTMSGIRLAGSQRYPFVDMDRIPPFQGRTHDGMVDDMIQAQRNLIDPNNIANPPDDVNNPTHVRGHRGACQLLLLHHHNLREGQCVDDLHQDHEGTAKDLTELLLCHAPRADPQMSDAALFRRIDNKLLSIKTPSTISRKVRTILKRSNWNGTEWRNWLLYFGVTCMAGLFQQNFLNVFSLISRGCYLLSQDSIEPEDINEAEELFTRAGDSFEALFGKERIKFNLHVTLCHKVNSVRKLGPQIFYSTYNFESLNMKIRARVTSPKGAAVQMVTRTLLHLTVHSAIYDDRYSEDVRDRLECMLNKQRLKRTVQVDPHTYLLGRGEEIELTEEEVGVLVREANIQQPHQVQKFKGFLIKNTRYMSLAAHNPDFKSDDTFVYTYQDTFCTLRKIIMFQDDQGEQRCGAFVTEHDVDHVVPIASQIVVLRNDNANLLHYIGLNQVCAPAIRMNCNNEMHVVCMPNCLEID